MPEQEIGPVVDVTSLETDVLETPVETLPETPQETPSETPSETPEKKALSFKDFADLRDDKARQVSPQGKLDLEDLQIKDKKEEEVKIEEPKKEPLKVKSRDYTGLSAEEARVFKSMSNEAYDKLRPIYEEKKKLESRLKEIEGSKEVPKQWYEHEDAVVLTPEYKQIVSNLQNYNFEQQYWRKQLIAIRNGDKWKPLLVDENNRYYEGTEKEPTTDAELDISSKLNMASTYSNQALGSLNMLKEGFKQKYSGLVGNIKGLEDKMFPFYSDPNNPHAENIKSVQASFPPELQLNPLTSLLAKMYVAMTVLGKRHEQVLGKLKLKQVVANDKKAAGPNASDVGTAAPIDSKPVITFDRFVNMRNT